MVNCVTSPLAKKITSGQPPEVLAESGLSFETRIKADSGNILFSYSVDEDNKANALGFDFMGAAKDHNGLEVHAFRMAQLNLPPVYENTIAALIRDLEALQLTLGADREVSVMQYNGGDDAPCYVKAMAPGPSEDYGRVVLFTTFI